MQLLHGMQSSHDKDIYGTDENFNYYGDRSWRPEMEPQTNREWTETSGAQRDEDVALRELSESAAKYTKSRKRRK
jgi:hypothetical protein